VNKGPPQWLEDKHGFPLPDGDTHVSAVWYMSSGTEVSSLVFRRAQQDAHQTGAASGEHAVRARTCELREDRATGAEIVPRVRTAIRWLL